MIYLLTEIREKNLYNLAIIFRCHSWWGLKLKSEWWVIIVDALDKILLSMQENVSYVFPIHASTQSIMSLGSKVAFRIPHNPHNGAVAVKRIYVLGAMT